MSSITAAETGNPRNSIEAHSQIFAIADRYVGLDLLKLAYSGFVAALEPGFTDKDARCQKLAADLIVAIPHIYTHTPPKNRRLCNAALTPWKAHGKRLLECADEVDLEELFRVEPEFAVDLVADLAEVVI